MQPQLHLIYCGLLTALFQVQNITLYGAGPTGNGTGSLVEDFYERSFALTFKSTLNETYTTTPIVVAQKASQLLTEAALGGAVELALQALPNKVVTQVIATAALGYEERAYTVAGAGPGVAFLNLAVEFRGASVMGAQNLLVVEAKPCGAGCTPRLTGLDLMSFAPNGTLSFVTEQVASGYGNHECGRRGKCDYESGLCSCFTGFTGQACTALTALV